MKFGEYDRFIEKILTKKGISESLPLKERNTFVRSWVAD